MIKRILYQLEAFEQEYIRAKEKHYRDSLELRQQINTGKVIDIFLPKQIDLNKVIKLIEKKYCSHLFIAIKIQTGYLTSHYSKNMYMPSTKEVTFF